MDARRISELAEDAKRLAATVPHTANGDDVTPWMQGVRGLCSATGTDATRAYIRDHAPLSVLGTLENSLAVLARNKGGFSADRRGVFEQHLSVVAAGLREVAVAGSPANHHHARAHRLPGTMM
ncbi:MAG: hypothetical protein ACRD96_06210 [Bryobacteraceae bacterium]